MSRRYFPAFLHVEGRSCLVVGSDDEAREKSVRLAAAGARVDVLAPSFSPAFLEGVARPGITAKTGSFRDAEVDGRFLVVLAEKTDPALTRRVAAACRERGALLCAIDQPDFCDVVNVSTAVFGRVTFAIGTGGAAPALARKIREGLTASLQNTALERFVEDLAALRQRLEQEGVAPAERRRRLIAAVDGFEFRASIQLPAERPERKEGA